MSSAGAAALFEALAQEIRRIAGKVAAREVGHTLQPTALVNELYLKLFEGRTRSWHDEVHFMRSAARAMRTILIDYKKGKQRQKRGGGVSDQPLDTVLHRLEAHCGGDVLEVNDALELLATKDPKLEEYVTLRFFGGRTNLETCRILGIGERTGESHWQFARAWLQRWLSQ